MTLSRQQILHQVFRKAKDYFIEKAYRRALEAMVDRGYEDDSVQKIGDKIIFNVEEKEIKKMTVEHMTIGKIDDFVDDWIDTFIDKPAYMEDEDFEDPTLAEQDEPRAVGGGTAIYPGSWVDIDALDEWVRTVKIKNDPMLQDIVDSDEFDEQVDRTVYRVARKIYYVGRKPSNITPEDWDNETSGMRPHEGTYAKGGQEFWTNKDKGFPYGADYTYRSGVID